MNAKAIASTAVFISTNSIDHSMTMRLPNRHSQPILLIAGNYFAGSSNMPINFYSRTRMPQLRHAFLVGALVSTLCGPSFAQATVDCENPAQASAFAADFRARLKSAQQDAKTKEQARQQAYAALTKRTVDAGMWNQQEADAFKAQAAASNPALKELETKRAAAAKEVGLSQYSMLAAESIGSVDPQAGKRMTCILGQKALGYLTAEDEAASAAAVLVTAQLTEEAKKKGVAGF